MATIADVSSIQTSGVLEIDALLGTGPAWNYQTGTTPTVMYFGFGNDQDHSTLVNRISEMTTGQRNAVRQALAYISELTGIFFQETATLSAQRLSFLNADILFDNTTGLTSWHSSYEYTSQDVITQYNAQAEIFLDVVDFPENKNPVFGTSGYETLLHEIGHALGLKHPFEGSPVLPKSLDSTEYTLMSYTSAGATKTEFQSLDIDALSWIYGGDGLGGDYGINSQFGPRADLVFDVTGTPGDDQLQAGKAGSRVLALAGNDRIVDSAGAHFLDGGMGRDTVVFSGLMSAYTITRTTDGSLTVDDNTGRDNLSAIERLEFLDQGRAFDTALGEAAANTLLFIGTLAFSALENQHIRRTLLDLFDRQYSLHDAFTLALDIGLVKELAGSVSTVSNLDLVRLAFRNIVGQEATDSVADDLVKNMVGDGGPYSQADFLVAASVLPINQSHVDLVGHSASGVAYALL